MHTLGASKCMHVVHSVGFRSVLVLGGFTFHDFGSALRRLFDTFVWALGLRPMPFLLLIQESTIPRIVIFHCYLCAFPPSQWSSFRRQLGISKLCSWVPVLGIWMDVGKGQNSSSLFYFSTFTKTCIEGNHTNKLYHVLHIMILDNH